MKLIDKITRVVIAISVAMLILSMFCRCTTTKYVPVTEYKDMFVVKTDSLLKTDSISSEERFLTEAAMYLHRLTQRKMEASIVLTHMERFLLML